MDNVLGYATYRTNLTRFAASVHCIFEFSLYSTRTVTPAWFVC